VNCRLVWPVHCMSLRFAILLFELRMVSPEPSLTKCSQVAEASNNLRPFSISNKQEFQLYSVAPSQPLRFG
jgi:hypothetical protein